MGGKRQVLRRWCSAGAWGGMGVQKRDGVAGFAPASGEAWAAPTGERFAAKYKEHLQEERQRIPLQHPDTTNAEARAEKQAAAELRDAVLHPRSLEPYVPDEPVDTSGTARGWSGELARPEAPMDYASLALGAPPPPPMPGLAAEAAPVPTSKADALAPPPAPPRTRRRYLHEVRYRRYRKQLKEFKATREAARVVKLQKVVAAGLATEADYARELKRLGIDVLKYPLPFKPRAYLQSEQQDTIRAFLLENVAATHAGDGAANAALAKLEAVLCDSMAAREEWLGLQEVLGRVLKSLERIDGGDLAPYRSEYYFELHKNLFARRAGFVRAHLVDPLPPDTVAQVNGSAHASLHTAFFSVPLCPPAVAKDVADGDVVAHLGTLHYHAFWTKCLEAKAARAPASPAKSAHAAPPEGASGGDSVAPPPPAPTTRLEWLDSKAAASWEERRTELAQLQELKKQRELDSVPDFEMVYSPGDMGVKPDGKSFSLHPSARMEYVVDEPVTRQR